MDFSPFLDIQSWWEVPSIAYFCSLFRTAFNLLDFDIEELEEALLTDGTEELASSLLTELIVRLLNGCLGNNDISAFNYQMYLRRLFRRKCQETGRYNPFNTDIDFQFLPLRTKVEILYALCDFRLDAEDVFDLFKNLEAESLRVEPLGWDDNDSAYWYFYGTRLYREDIIKKPKGKSKKKKVKDSKKRGWFYGDDWLDDDETERVWQVVCFTEEDWTHLTEKFSKATSKVEKELYRSLSQNFLPEIPRLFQEKERLQRERLLELAPRRTSSRVLQKIKQKEEDIKQTVNESKELDVSKGLQEAARESRALRRNLLRSKSVTSESSKSSQDEKTEMPQKVSKRSRSLERRSKNASATHKGEPPTELPIKTGRKTNNSLASATGQILIPDNDEQPVNSTRKKLKTSQIFGLTDEDVQTDMYKVLEQLTAHEDAWPFMDPVEEEYAPNYYAVIRRPMDLHKMEERLDSGYYSDFSIFKADFKLIVNNCRLYNGQDNEYTMMVDNLQAAFDRLTEKYIHRVSSSDEEIAVEYQLPTPSRKHKLKSSESPSRHKRKKKKTHSESGDHKTSVSERNQEDDEKQDYEANHSDGKLPKELHKKKLSKEKGKKKRKGHHRHGKHSKNHKKSSHKSVHNEKSKSKHSKKQKHNKDREGKKSKQNKKKVKNHEMETNISIKKSPSQASVESLNHSRSASPLPSIHTLTPSPTELDQTDKKDQPPDPDFFKDKYDKIKERRRNANKETWESLFEYKQKSIDKQKQNINLPEKDKNQKLRETIERLKAKNEKYKDSTLYNSSFSSGNKTANKTGESSSGTDSLNKDDENTDGEVEDALKGKTQLKKGNKKNTAKNESASEALEQAVKDISKWLDDAPKSSIIKSPSDSLARTISNEEQDNSKLDDDLLQSEKTLFNKKDISRKRPSSREPKLVKRREIQRTIDRLQPGKSKGNLISNITPKNAEKVEEAVPLGPAKTRDAGKVDETSPKLSLGSVLPTVEFTLGNDHKFNKSEENLRNRPENTTKQTETQTEVAVDEIPIQTKPEEVIPSTVTRVESEPTPITKPSQEKATPNLSAWFKAFGAPKAPAPTANTAKKKLEENEPDEKPSEVTTNADKLTSPKNVNKSDSPTDPGTPNPEGGDSPLPNPTLTPRQRRTSTGSSISERSSFSQDLDSPRHQMSHNSPLLRSPASPRTDDFQKITYPIINGTVRAGFYQDTTSIKSSPEKSCSPREAPLSPYSPYSQHVYASNNALGSSTPNYFVDHNKSPLPAYTQNPPPTYSQNPPPFYDTSKAPVVSKPVRTHDDYTALGPDTFPPAQYSSPYSPVQSPYPQAQPQPSPLPMPPSPVPVTNPAPAVTPAPTPPVQDAKSLFPVKKRTYSEPGNTPVVVTKVPESVDATIPLPIKSDHHRVIPHSMHSMANASVDDIAAALTEKSELAKLNSLREKPPVECIDIPITENKEATYESTEVLQDKKKDATINIAHTSIQNDNVDMVNMGYMNPENDRRHCVDPNEMELMATKNLSKPMIMNPQPKGYEVEKIAMNLGLNNQQILKNSLKCNMSAGNIPPAHTHEIPHAHERPHTHERSHNDVNMNQNMTQAHHNQYDQLPGQSLSNFSLNDIEIANKKLYACTTASATAAREYCNWKMTNHMRKQDLIPSDYSTPYNTSSQDKLKNEVPPASNPTAINYNKNLQHHQYHNYNVPRNSIQRTQELQQSLPAELRIPNPRGLIKNDHHNVGTSVSDANLTAKNMDAHLKSQKQEKNHPLVGSIPYKPPYSTHSTLPVDSLRNLPNIPQMLDRYTNDDRYLSSFSTSGGSSLYHDKTFQMAQMFNKSMSSEMLTSTPSSIYSQTAMSMSKESNIYKASTSISSAHVDTKAKSKRKRTESKPPVASSQAYHAPACNTDVLSSVKTSMVPGSAFNFGTTPNMSLGGGLYGDNAAFTIDDFRNSTNQIMAANYMAAAVAHQQRSTAEAGSEKLKAAHQNSSHTSGTFPFLGHAQVRGGYGFVGGESSPLYQQYLQRHQEELLRQTGAQIMGLYSPGYPAALPVRQPYDSINRPSWL